LAVTSAQRLGFKPIEDWLEDVPVDAWRRLSAGDGAKGPRLYDWAYRPYRADAAAGWAKGVLIRRTIKMPAAFTFYLTLAPDVTPLAELARVVGTRWTIEACFEAAKGEVGLDAYEVRLWIGWHRHVTLAMLAHADLAVHREMTVGGERHQSQHRIVASHRPELRLLWARPPDRDAVLGWSHWRRRHQQRARRCHWRRRTRLNKARL
jgi:SRSO17 transposase